MGFVPISFAWSINHRFFGRTSFWLVILMAACVHGLLLLFLSWLMDMAIRRLVKGTMVVRFAGLAILVSAYGCVLFFAWPLRDC